MGHPYWTYYQDAFELLVIFSADGKAVDRFKIIALKQKERKKLDLLANLKEQKTNILPERIPEIEALVERFPTVVWERRMNQGIQH